MESFSTVEVSENVRLRWVYDHDYETRGSYAYDTEEETRRAEDEEIDALSSGRFVALGAIVEVRCPCCGSWDQKDSLWGIVIEPTDKALAEFAEDSLDIPNESEALAGWSIKCN